MLQKDDDIFLANYSDGLSDLDLDDYLAFFYRQNKIASFLSVKPSQSFHVVHAAEDGIVQNIEPVAQSSLWINGGFFIFRKEIFDYIRWGDELVVEPFNRLTQEGQLLTYQNRGFWA